MHSIASPAGVRRLFVTSILARLPLATLSIGLLVHARHLTGSFAAAGVVTGVYAIAVGIGGPLLGQLVDRRGQTSVLLASATVAAALLVAIAVQPVGAPLAVLLALAAGIGLAEPPVGACLRTQLPALLSDPGAVRAAYALEASVVELTFIFGPPLALCIGALWSTGAALAAGGIVLLLATTAFAAQPASRSWRPAPAQPRPPGGSLRAPAMRTLVIVLIAVGVLLGADEVAVVAAAKTLDSTTAAAPLLALWGAGSFLGGLLIARLGGGARTATGLAIVLAALTAGHLALIPAAGSVPSLGAVLFLAGAAIAPTEATVYAMVDDAAPAGTMTEAFAWLATAMAVGGAVGAAGAGILLDRAGPTAAFALAGGAGALAALMTMLRSRTLVDRAPAIADTVAATGTASIVAKAAPVPAVDRKGARLATALFDVVAPIVLYYGLRAAGVGIYLALLAGAVAPGVSTVGRLVRLRTVDRLAVFVMTTMLLGVGVALIAGSPRFLLAKEGWVTAAGGAWFLLTARGRRPLAFLFARPLLEGRRAFTSEPWDSLWERLPRFRRVWRISSVIWGIGLLADAGIRVAIAYILPIDVVPGAAGALYPVTFLALQVIDQINYRRSGLWQMLLTRGDPAERRRRNRGSHGAARLPGAPYRPRHLADPRWPPARALGRAQQPRVLPANRCDPRKQLTRPHRSGRHQD